MRDACALKRVTLPTPYGIVVGVNAQGAAFVKDVLAGQSAFSDVTVQVGMYIVSIGADGTPTKGLTAAEVDVAMDMAARETGVLTLGLGVPVHVVLAPRNFFPAPASVPALTKVVPVVEEEASPIYVAPRQEVSKDTDMNQAAAPVLSLGEDSKVTMMSDTPGVSIYYTIDGSVPVVRGGVNTSSSTYLYGSLKPFLNTKQAQRLIVCAIARKPGLDDSPMSRGEYIVEQCKSCTMSTRAPQPARLSPFNFVEVIIDCPASGADIFYEIFEVPAYGIEAFVASADVSHLYETAIRYDPSYPPALPLGTSACVVAYATMDLHTPSEMTVLPVTFNETTARPVVTVKSTKREVFFDVEAEAGSKVFYYVSNKAFDLSDFARIAANGIIAKALQPPAKGLSKDTLFPSDGESQLPAPHASTGAHTGASLKRTDSKTIFAGAFDSTKALPPPDSLHGYAQLSRQYPSTVSSFASYIDPASATESPYQLQVASTTIKIQTTESGVTTLQAIARSIGKHDSAIATGSIRTTKCLPVSISPLSGAELAKSMKRLVTLTTEQESGTIMYTLNGSNPSDDANADVVTYTTPFKLLVTKGPITVKACCRVEGNIDSVVAEVEFVRPPPPKRVEVMPVLSGDTYMANGKVPQNVLLPSSSKTHGATFGQLGLATEVVEIKTHWKASAAKHQNEIEEGRKQEGARAHRLLLMRKLCANITATTGDPGKLFDTVFEWLWEEACTDLQQWQTVVRRNWIRHKAHGDGPYTSFVKELGPLEQYDPAKRPPGAQRYKKKLVGTQDPPPYGSTQTKTAQARFKREEQRRKKLTEVNQKLTAFARSRKELHFYVNYIKTTPLNVIYSELDVLTKDINWMTQHIADREYETYGVSPQMKNESVTKAQAVYLSYASKDTAVPLIQKTIEVPFIEIVKQLYPRKAGEPEPPAPAKTWNTGRRGSTHLAAQGQENELAKNNKFKFQVKQFHGNDEVILSNTDVKSTQDKIAGQLSSMFTQGGGNDEQQNVLPAPKVKAATPDFSFGAAASSTESSTSSARPVMPTGLLAGITSKSSSKQGKLDALGNPLPDIDLSKPASAADAAARVESMNFNFSFNSTPDPTAAPAPTTSSATRASVESTGSMKRNSMIAATGDFGAELKAKLNQRNSVAEEPEPEAPKTDVKDKESKGGSEQSSFSFSFNTASDPPAPAAPKEPKEPKAEEVVTAAKPEANTKVVKPEPAEPEPAVDDEDAKLMAEIAALNAKIAAADADETPEATVEDQTAAPSSADAAPGPADDVPGPADDVPGPADDVPLPADSAPGPTDDVVPAAAIPASSAAAVPISITSSASIEVTLKKPLGISIAEREGVLGVTVSKIKAGSSAEAAGGLAVGMHLMSINGQSLDGKSKAEVASMIKAAGDEVVIVFEQREDVLEAAVERAIKTVPQNFTQHPSQANVDEGDEDRVPKDRQLSLQRQKKSKEEEITAGGNNTGRSKRLSVKQQKRDEGQKKALDLAEKLLSDEISGEDARKSILSLPGDGSGEGSSRASTNDQVPTSGDADEETAAIRIQAQFRGHQVRKSVMHASEETAAVKIQAQFRGHQVRKSAKVASASASDVPPASDNGAPGPADVAAPQVVAAPSPSVAETPSYDGLTRLKLVKMCRDRGIDYKAVAKDVDALVALLTADDGAKSGGATETTTANTPAVGSSDDGLIRVTLTKPLGMSIAGSAAEGITVTKVKEGSSAALAGTVEVGMRLMEMNGENLVGKEKNDVVALIKAAPAEIVIVLSKPAAAGESGVHGPPTTAVPPQDSSQGDELPQKTSGKGSKKTSDNGLKKTSGKGSKKTSGKGKSKLSSKDVGKLVKVEGFE